MALSVDTTTNFTSSVGYTLFNGANITFSAGTAFLGLTYVGTGAIRTPQIDVSGWFYLCKIIASITESVGYQHRFLLSFDDWSGSGRKYYCRLTPAAWEPVASDLSTEAELLAAALAGGMGVDDLADIRTWPAGVQQVSVLVHMQRTDAADDGNITLLSLFYGSDVLTTPVEPDPVGTLAFDPEFPVKTGFRQSVETFSFKQYRQTVARATRLRRSWDSLTWKLDATDAATVAAFLRSHQVTPFTWTPCGDATARAAVCVGVPKITMDAAGIYTVTASLEESLK